eukprot:747274-Hanusia_phi.AAC.5
MPSSSTHQILFEWHLHKHLADMDVLQNLPDRSSAAALLAGGHVRLQCLTCALLLFSPSPAAAIPVRGEYSKSRPATLKELLLMIALPSGVQTEEKMTVCGRC